MKALVVEDSRSMRLYLEKSLLALGHEVKLCSTAEEGLEAFAAERFEIVVADWILPAMNGLEFCRQVRRMKHGDECVITMITSQSKPQDLEAVLDSGADDYVAKPVDERMLMTRLKVVSRMAVHLTDCKRAEKQIRESLKDKEMLLREIHHRVKNHLQVLASLLALQSRQARDAEARELLLESENRVMAITMIHEKLYRSEDISQVDLGGYVRDLAAAVAAAYSDASERVKLEISTEPVEVDAETLIPLGLIVNEMLSNAFKHAFPKDRSGVIKVSAGKAGDGLVYLSLSDNGAGMPDDIDIGRTPSMGMMIINSLVEQIGASMEVSRDGGTSFRLKFSGSRVA